MRLAVILVLIAISYLLLRVANVVPNKQSREIARSVDIKRADSLETRFSNEDQLLAHAWERKWFGWAHNYGNRVDHGWMGMKTASITDGYWIIVFGHLWTSRLYIYFWIARLANFPSCQGDKSGSKFMRKRVFGPLAVIVSINIFDLLPKSSITPWTWLLVGALLGRAEVNFRYHSRKGGESVQILKLSKPVSGIHRKLEPVPTTMRPKKCLRTPQF